MKKCPCCNKKTLNDENVMNSLSHIDDKTYICNACGQVESMLFLDTKNVTTGDVDNYYKFKKSLGK